VYRQVAELGFFLVPDVLMMAKKEKEKVKAG